MSVTAFMEKHYRHYNARETLSAARSYKEFVEDGGKMLVSLAGASGLVAFSREGVKIVAASQLYRFQSHFG